MIDDVLSMLFNTRKPLPEAERFYRRLLHHEDFLSVAPQVYHHLHQQDRLTGTPAFFQEQLQRLFSDTFYKNMFIKNQEHQLLLMLERKWIEAIPLKGIHFAETYFNHLAARPTSDIDLLIKYHSLEEVIDIVRSLGFTYTEPYIPSHFHKSFSKRIAGSPVPLTVELHWDILKADTANHDIQSFWNHSHQLGSYNYIKQLSALDTFYMICLHGWRHNLCSLKYFIDIVQLIIILKDAIDYDELLETAVADKTFRRIVRTLSIIYREFPFLETILEFPEKRSFVLWDYKFFDKTNKDVRAYLDFIDYQFFSYDSATHSYKEVVNIVKAFKNNRISR